VPTQQQVLCCVGTYIRCMAAMTEEETGLDELELRQPQAVVEYEEIGARVKADVRPLWACPFASGASGKSIG
jgi:hypothetical protein